MVLIIGGAYQGKLSYALERYDLTESDVYFCREYTSVFNASAAESNINTHEEYPDIPKADIPKVNIPEGKKVIYEIDKWIFALVKAEIDTTEMIKQFILRNSDAIVICNDISGGIVPTEKELRKWREAVGMSMAKLSQHSKEVVRLFCGIPTVIGYRD